MCFGCYFRHTSHSWNILKTGIQAINDSNMNVQFITAVLISFFVIILSTEGTIVRKCEGKLCQGKQDEL